MGELIPFERRHSVSAKYHALWDIEPAKDRYLREVEARPQPTAEERYDEALQDLFGLMRPEISNELAATVVARLTFAAIECGLEDNLEGAS